MVSPDDKHAHRAPHLADQRAHAPHVRHGRVACLACHRVVHDQHGEPAISRRALGVVQRAALRADHRRGRPRQPRIARRRRLGHLTRGTGLEARDDRFGKHRSAAPPVQNRERLRVGAFVRDGRARGNHREVVANDVRKRQRVGVRRRGRRQKPPLDGGHVLAHGVQLVDVRARLEQPPDRVLLVLERDAVGRQGHQRRPAAREQHQQQVPGAGAAGDVQRPARAPHAAVGRHRMTGVHPLHPFRHRRVGRSHAQHCARAARRPVEEGLQHRGRCLARGHHVYRRGRRHQPAHVGRRERAGHERARIHGLQGRTRDDCQVCAEIGEVDQWTCRGSVNPDAPVTKSN